MTKSAKHSDKRRNGLKQAISSFVTMFSESVYMRERVNLMIIPFPTHKQSAVENFENIQAKY